MESFNNFVTAANGILWGPIMLVALIGTMNPVWVPRLS